MTLNIIATITAKPGSEPLVAQALRSLLEPTRAEPGCLSYELFRSSDDPAVFVFVEQWREQADLTAHQQTPHMAAAFAAAGEHLAEPPVIHEVRAVDPSDPPA